MLHLHVLVEFVLRQLFHHAHCLVEVDVVHHHNNTNINIDNITIVILHVLFAVFQCLFPLVSLAEVILISFVFVLSVSHSITKDIVCNNVFCLQIVHVLGKIANLKLQ